MPQTCRCGPGSGRSRTCRARSTPRRWCPSTHPAAADARLRGHRQRQVDQLHVVLLDVLGDLLDAAQQPCGHGRGCGRACGRRRSPRTCRNRLGWRAHVAGELAGRRCWHQTPPPSASRWPTSPIRDNGAPQDELADRISGWRARPQQHQHALREGHRNLCAGGYQVGQVAVSTIQTPRGRSSGHAPGLATTACPGSCTARVAPRHDAEQPQVMLEADSRAVMAERLGPTRKGRPFRSPAQRSSASGERQNSPP